VGPIFLMSCDLPILRSNRLVGRRDRLVGRRDRLVDRHNRLVDRDRRIEHPCSTSSVSPQTLHLSVPTFANKNSIEFRPVSPSLRHFPLTDFTFMDFLICSCGPNSPAIPPSLPSFVPSAIYVGEQNSISHSCGQLGLHLAPFPDYTPSLPSAAEPNHAPPPVIFCCYKY